MCSTTNKTEKSRPRNCRDPDRDERALVIKMKTLEIISRRGHLFLQCLEMEEKARWYGFTFTYGLLLHLLCGLENKGSRPGPLANKDDLNSWILITVGVTTY